MFTEVDVDQPVRCACRHPLYPLLAMLFEKCESATANVDKVTTTDMFNAEMVEFAKAMNSNRASMPGASPLIGGNDELDNLVSHFF